MKRSRESTIRELARLFHRNGYVRRQNPRRYRKEGYKRYKKGDEVRLTAVSETELALIRRLLAAAGFRAGRAFVKGRLFRQPVYGREAVRRFIDLVGERKPAKPLKRLAAPRRARTV